MLAVIAPYEAAGVRRGRAAGERKDLGGPCRKAGVPRLVHIFGQVFVVAVANFRPFFKQGSASLVCLWSPSLSSVLLLLTGSGSCLFSS